MSAFDESFEFSDKVPRGEISLARAILLPAACLVLFLLGVVSKLAAQTPPFSFSSKYTSMLDELHHDPVRSSRMAADALRATPQQPVHLKAAETAAALRLETGAWRLEITKGRLGMALTNKQTGLTWQLAGSDAEPDNPPELRLAKVQHIERQGDIWRMHVEAAGSSAPAELEIAVVSPTIIRLSIRAP